MPWLGPYGCTKQQHHCLSQQLLLEKPQASCLRCHTIYLCQHKTAGWFCGMEQPRERSCACMPEAGHCFVHEEFFVHQALPQPAAVMCSRAHEGCGAETSLLVQHWAGPSLQRADALPAQGQLSCMTLECEATVTSARTSVKALRPRQTLAQWPSGLCLFNVLKCKGTLHV